MGKRPRSSEACGAPAACRPPSEEEVAGEGTEISQCGVRALGGPGLFLSLACMRKFMWGG